MRIVFFQIEIFLGSSRGSKQGCISDTSSRHTEEPFCMQDRQANTNLFEQNQQFFHSSSTQNNHSPCLALPPSDQTLPSSFNQLNSYSENHSYLTTPSSPPVITRTLATPKTSPSISPHPTHKPSVRHKKQDEERSPSHLDLFSTFSDKENLLKHEKESWNGSKACDGVAVEKIKERLHEGLAALSMNSCIEPSSAGVQFLVPPCGSDASSALTSISKRADEEASLETHKVGFFKLFREM